MASGGLPHLLEEVEAFHWFGGGAEVVAVLVV